jgi:hypothetical protein
MSSGSNVTERSAKDVGGLTNTIMDSGLAWFDLMMNFLREMQRASLQSFSSFGLNESVSTCLRHSAAYKRCSKARAASWTAPAWPNPRRLAHPRAHSISGRKEGFSTSYRALDNG